MAALQYAVGPDPARNAAAIVRGLRAAAERGARLALTPECGLSGYVGWDFDTLAQIDRSALRAATATVQEACAAVRCWLALGSTHFLDDDTPPLNCLYIIDDRGDIVDRYDKVCLTGTDQRFFSAGDRSVVQTIDGVTVGFRICHDICYADSYAELRGRGARVVAHAFHNAGFAGPNVLDEVGPAWLRARAADHQLWIVATNSAKAHSCWPSCFARPDGRLVEVAPRHAEAQLVRAVPAPLPDDDDTWLHNDPDRLPPAARLRPIGQTTAHPRAVSITAPP